MRPGWFGAGGGVAELFVELASGLGVRAGQQLIEDIDHLIHGVAVALPEKADQAWLAFARENL
jgi:hypothetical protein